MRSEDVERYQALLERLAQAQTQDEALRLAARVIETQQAIMDELLGRLKKAMAQLALAQNQTDKALQLAQHTSDQLKLERLFWTQPANRLPI